MLSRSGRPRRGRSAVEQRRVARLHPHRQYRRARSAGETDETALPAAIADAAQRQPRDLAGREHDHALLGGQRLFNRMQAATLRLATEDAHRQQQILQRRDRAQQVVGHDPHVAADAADRVQQGQRVQGTGGMVGDDQQAAGGRDLRQCGRVHLVLAVDEFQAGGDEAESAQACAALQEGFDLVQPRPAADAAQQRPRQLATAAMEPIGEALLKALFDLRPAGGSHVAVSGQNDDRRPGVAGGAVGAVRPPARCHAGGTLGTEAGAQSCGDGPWRAYTALTTANRYLFTSESVSEGHPDKVADQISDAVLDAILTQDQRARVACETMVKTGVAIVAAPRSASTAPPAAC
ncbi:hypothetical protein G6F22_013221 [Rhizopus arrhizus]|nr:hypothetical protein G6F22_013221 [Rhizopus arrhizus]